MKLDNLFQHIFTHPDDIYITTDRSGKVVDFEYSGTNNNFLDYANRQFELARQIENIPDDILYHFNLRNRFVPFQNPPTFNFIEEFLRYATRQNIKPECRIELIDFAYAVRKRIDLKELTDLSVLSDESVFKTFPDYQAFKYQQKRKTIQNRNRITVIDTPDSTSVFENTLDDRKKFLSFLQHLADNFFSPNAPDQISIYKIYTKMRKPEDIKKFIQEENLYPYYSLSFDSTNFYKLVNDFQLKISERNNAIAKLIYTDMNGYDPDMTGTLPYRYRKEFNRISGALKKIPDYPHSHYTREKKRFFAEDAKEIAHKLLCRLNIRGYENLAQILADEKRTVTIGGKKLTSPERKALIDGKHVILNDVLSKTGQKIGINIFLNQNSLLLRIIQKQQAIYPHDIQRRKRLSL